MRGGVRWFLTWGRHFAKVHPVRQLLCVGCETVLADSSQQQGCLIEAYRNRLQYLGSRQKRLPIQA